MKSFASVYPGLWPAGVPDLGTLDVSYIPPIPEASHYWSALKLPAGKVQAWTDQVSGAQLVPPSAAQAPDTFSSPRKGVRFDGTVQRMGVATDLTGPRTFAVVGRFTKAAPNQVMTYGLNGGTPFNIYQGANGNFAFSTGKTLASTKPGDTGRHVFLAVSNGANSVLSIDGEEWLGDAGSTPAAAGFRIGADASSYTGLEIEAIVLLPFAADQARRAALTAQLTNHYRI